MEIKTILSHNVSITKYRKSPIKCIIKSSEMGKHNAEIPVNMICSRNLLAVFPFRSGNPVKGETILRYVSRVKALFCLEVLFWILEQKVINNDKFYK